MDGIELRYAKDADGNEELDEVVGGSVRVHLERMSDKTAILILDDPMTGRQVLINLSAPEGGLEMTVTEDTAPEPMSTAGSGPMGYVRTPEMCEKGLWGNWTARDIERCPELKERLERLQVLDGEGSFATPDGMRPTTLDDLKAFGRTFAALLRTEPGLNARVCWRQVANNMAAVAISLKGDRHPPEEMPIAVSKALSMCSPILLVQDNVLWRVNRVWFGSWTRLVAVQNADVVLFERMRVREREPA